MRVLVVGLGSMGKRRVRTLRALGVREVVGTDLRADRAREAAERYGIRVVPSFDEGMATNPHAVVISTPPNQHLEYAREAAKAKVHVFTECNWVEDLSELEALDELCSQHGLVGAPSCTQRFQGSIRRMKELVEDGVIGPVLHVEYHSGQWAPDWHPWEKVTDFYLGKKGMGGGREQVSFELGWIRWICGAVVGVTALTRKLTTLPIDIFDLYQINLDFQSGAVGSVIVDMIQRYPNRICNLMTEEGQIEWDYIAGVVRLYQASSKHWIDYKEQPGESGYLSEGGPEDEPLYLEEMQAFLQAVEGGPRFPYSFMDEREILAIVHAAERSSASGSYIKLNNKSRGAV